MTLSSLIVGLVVGLNSIAIAMIAGVFILHLRAWKKAPRGTGVIPFHVMMMSASQIILLVLAADQILPPNGTSEWTWQFTSYLVAIVMAITALILIGEYQRNRLVAVAKQKFSDEGDVR